MLLKKEYYDENKEIIIENNKEYRIEHKDEINKKSKEYYANNKNEIIKRQNNYNKNRRINNLIYRLIVNNRTRIYDALKSNSKTAHTIYLLGCDRFIFYQWIQFQLP